MYLWLCFRRKKIIFLLLLLDSGSLLTFRSGTLHASKIDLWTNFNLLFFFLFFGQDPPASVMSGDFPPAGLLLFPIACASLQFQTTRCWLSDTLCHIMALQLPTVSRNARLSNTGARRCSLTLTTRCPSTRSRLEILMEPCLTRQTARSVHVNTGRLVLHAPWYSQQHHHVDGDACFKHFTCRAACLGGALHRDQMASH